MENEAAVFFCQCVSREAAAFIYGDKTTEEKSGKPRLKLYTDKDRE